MMSLRPVTNALLLLIAANLLPWALGRLCRNHWAAPLDFGCALPGGKRLLGLMVLRQALALSWLQVIAVTATFVLLDVLSMRLRHPGRRARPGLMSRSTDSRPR